MGDAADKPPPVPRVADAWHALHDDKDLDPGDCECEAFWMSVNRASNDETVHLAGYDDPTDSSGSIFCPAPYVQRGRSRIASAVRRAPGGRNRLAPEADDRLPD